MAITSRAYRGIVLVAPVAVALAGFAAWDLSRTTPSPEQLEKYAANVIEACAGEGYRPACYDREIPQLMNAGLTLEEAFEITKIVQARDGNYWYCHVLGHELAAQETKKDPAAWKDVVARCGSGMCSNGCIHGAFQERFRADALPDASIEEVAHELFDICEARPHWQPTGMEQASCYHALGHLTMYITAADVNKSVAVCDKVSRKPDGRDFLSVCYDGVYMQIFQPLEPEDFALVKDIAPESREAARAFCAQFGEEQQAPCWRESWPLSFKEIKTPQGLVDFCSVWEKERYRTRCFHAMFFVLPAQFNFDEGRIAALCEALPDELRGMCFTDAAARFIETDYRLIEKSINFCAEAEEFGAGNQCYDGLVFYSGFNFRPNSPEFLRLCQGLPEPWRGECLAETR